MDFVYKLGNAKISGGISLSLCIRSQCVIIEAFCANPLPQNGQTKGRSPVCTVWCRRTWYGFLKVFGHCGHWWWDLTWAYGPTLCSSSNDVYKINNVENYKNWQCGYMLKLLQPSIQSLKTHFTSRGLESCILNPVSLMLQDFWSSLFWTLILTTGTWSHGIPNVFSKWTLCQMSENKLHKSFRYW
jgi:hypothetical protein